MWPFTKKKSLRDIRSRIPRDQIVRKSRILIIDDEEPSIIEDLRSSNFCVEYLGDITPQTLHKLDSFQYDLILLDFSGVGATIGRDEGLSILRHIKRVNKAVVVIAYTSKALYSSQADFFTLSDAYLSKDAGVQETLEKVEEYLQVAHSAENLWKAYLDVHCIEPGSEKDRELQHAFVSGLNDSAKLQKMKDLTGTNLSDEMTKVAAIALFEKLVSVGVGAI